MLRRDRILALAAALGCLSIGLVWTMAPGVSATPPSPPPDQAAAGAAPREKLANHAFQIEYDDTGIRSLRRTADVHDTDYIAPNGALGRLVVRYRSSPHGDWRELRDLLPRAKSAQGIAYTLAARRPPLASRISPSAERGVGGLRALNDGLVPPAGAPDRGSAPSDVPVFAWTRGPNEPGGGGPGAVGQTRWVQYTFPVVEEVGRAEVYWVSAPASWRLLYADAGRWLPVGARGAYSTDAHRFVAVDFAPVRTTALRLEVVMPASGPVSLAEWRVGAEPPLAAPGDLRVDTRFELAGDALEWTIALANDGARPIEVGDLAVPLNFTERVGARGDIYTKKLLRHAFVAGHGSWVYWQRSNGAGPYLLMTPGGSTALQYFDSSGGVPGGSGAFTPYVHAKAASAAAAAAGGNWRLPISSLTLAPGAATTYSFRFAWAKDFAGVRAALYAAGKFDTAIAPGMVVPVDLPALVSLRTTQKIDAVQAEHPASTRVERVGAGPGGEQIYRVGFSRLGENMLTVRYGDRLWTTLEFFVTEPLETVIKKRAAFLVDRHQHTDASKWYVGAYGDWDQKNEVLRGPEDRDGLSSWLTDANDDAGNARPAFVASKNVFYPDRREIESLELYISRYLWGGMQMTDAERYPYAIYGIPNWMANRASPDPGRNGQAHVWRIYDYPHIVMLYFRMYQIAKFYPELVTHLDAPQYLERAYRTAVAYWTVPMAVEKWSADAVGTMNEAFIPELIDALEREGRRGWAATLRGHWEGKVDRFVNRTPNLYGSEFAFDSTGFESTGAFAKYALTRDAPDFRARVGRDAAQRFMEFQLLLNMSDRGWLETTYYQLGSDYRGSMTYLLSYMSQLGGWAILDYALHFAKDPTDYLRLGYASSLSSWALVNSGTAESGHGAWFPSRANDGAAGGGFMPEPLGRAWIGKTMARGAWYYSAEQDVGYCGALRTHATIVARDPVFGELAYGGVLTRSGSVLRVIPRDGLRARFHIVRDAQRFHLVLERDGFARERPIVVSDDLSRIEFTLEHRGGGAHETTLAMAGLPAGRYEISVDGRVVRTIDAAAGEQRVAVPAGAGAIAAVAIVRNAR